MFAIVEILKNQNIKPVIIVDNIMKQQVIELVTALGWTDLGDQKNPWMISFMNEGIRLNVYFTTMTATIQSSKNNIRIIRNATLEDLEKFII